MTDNEQKPGEDIPKTPERLEREYQILRELAQELVEENKILRQTISEYEKPLEKYYDGWSWITKIIFVITQSGRPLCFSELYAIMLKKDTQLGSHTNPKTYLSTALSKAKQTKRLLTHKVAGVRGDYYCLPQWMDEDNTLIDEMKNQIGW
jgi:hypothetical protein